MKINCPYSVHTVHIYNICDIPLVYTVQYTDILYIYICDMSLQPVKISELRVTARDIILIIIIFYAIMSL